jgi:hypothetical protein
VESRSCFTFALSYHAAEPELDGKAHSLPVAVHLHAPLQVLAVGDLPENLILLKLQLADIPLLLTTVEMALML